MDPATMAALAQAAGSAMGALGGQGGGPIAQQPYSNSGAISVGGVGMPAGPIPSAPASPFTYFQPDFQGAATSQNLTSAAPLLLFGLGLAVVAAAKKKG